MFIKTSVTDRIMNGNKILLKVVRERTESLFLPVTTFLQITFRLCCQGRATRTNFTLKLLFFYLHGLFLV